MKTALITGITGQDGSYLAELLLEKGYDVHGIIRRSSVRNTGRIDHIFDRLKIHYGDLGEGGVLTRLITKVQPDEIYNLGAMSHVKVSYEIPEYTADVTGVGALRLLEAVREVGCLPRIYQASSSEMFGSALPPQSETTPFHPRSPYGCAKVFAYWATVNYRESYGLHASNGILFNHESPRRGLTFVTRKITQAVARIARGEQKELVLGNLNAKRDWGFAGDYVEGMWRMLQADKPDDYVLATGEAHSVREFCELAFRQVGLDWEKHVRVDPSYFRPAEVDFLLGDPSKARQQLGWNPSVNFLGLVKMMVQHDLDNPHSNI
jgi:GDPmannose 4,6-dehydratase